MNDPVRRLITGSWILSKRGKKNPVDPFVPYGWLVEKERSASGTIDDMAIVFLTNRECPFHCLMCDLWKNTTDEVIPEGAITTQIDIAIKNFPGVRHIKLYNSGSFFDPKAIRPSEFERIAVLLKDFETVIVESHPAFINENVLQFRDLLKPRLEVAVGLETIHPQILPLLNKKMDTERFGKAAKFLTSHNIQTRSFILLKTPYMSEDEGIQWAQRSIDFAFNAGVECCTIIPVRAGNGAMDYLKDNGLFSLPAISSIEKVLEYGIRLGKGRVFADTWDLGLFATPNDSVDEITQRIHNMNLTQCIPA